MALIGPTLIDALDAFSEIEPKQSVTSRNAATPKRITVRMHRELPLLSTGNGERAGVRGETKAKI